MALTGMGTKANHRSNRFHSWPALRIVLAYGSGLLLQSAFKINASVIWVCMLAGLSVYWGVHARSSMRASPFMSMVQLKAYLLVVVLFGMQRFGYLQHTETPEQSDEWDLSVLVGEPVMIQATVYQVRTKRTGSTLWVRSDSLFYQSRLVSRSRVELLLRWEAEDALPEIGDRIRVLARLREPPNVRNPFEFDYSEWLKRQGIRFQGTIDGLVVVEPHRGGLTWLSVRRKIDQLIRLSFQPDQVPIAKALLLGQKGDVEPEDRLAFARSGLSHLMAVSGLHVGFVVAPLWLVIPFLWSSPIGRHIGFVGMAAVLFLYCGITGLSASVVRASVMSLLAAYARMYRHPRDPINLMSLAALIILVFDPRSLWDVGFQLSFAAVALLLIVLPPLQRSLPDRLSRKPWSLLTGTILVSVVVQLGLYPILASDFGEYSMAGVVSNMAGIPLTQIMILWSMAGLPLCALFPDSAPLLMWPADQSARLLTQVASIAGSWEWSWWHVAKPHPMIYPTWLTAAFAVAGFRSPHRWKLVILFLACLLAWRISDYIQTVKQPLVEVLFFDVGQGDAALIRTKGGSNWLIDAGVISPTYDSGARTLLPVLRRLGIERLDGLVLTHPHADHVGGTLALVESMPIDTIYEADFPTSSMVVAGYRSAARKHGVPLAKVRSGRLLNIDEGIRARILGPIDPEHHSDPNTASVVVRLDAGTTSFLFTGDADEEAEQQLLLKYGPLLRSTVLKAGHHGSRTSSSLPFMMGVAPQHVVVSLGLVNRYRHPHPEAVLRLRSTGAKMHYTSLNSAVWMASDGLSIWEVDWK